MAGTNLFEVTDLSFDTEVLQSAIPVLVDFWAPWCGPCKAIAPIVEAMANDYQGKLKVAKINVDNSPKVAMRYGVRSIPTVMVFKNGDVIEQAIGAMPRTALEKKVLRSLES